MATRRTVLRATLAGATIATFVGTLGGLRNAVAAGAAVPVRKTLHGMSPDDDDLVAYRDFVGIMQQKDQSAPLSWLGFSLQHGNMDTGRYKYCPHGDWYFLPWHRAYVVMYENAVRTLTSHPRFAMPYWDWTLDRTIPSPFTDTTYKGKPNPLYVSTRTLSNPTRWPLRDSIVGPKVMEAIYRENDFQLFGTSKNPAQNNLDMSWVVRGGGSQGILERTPHNTVHNYTGGFMPSPGSPRDPVFFMHHSNIDRIWAYWNAMGKSNTSGMDPATQRLWLEMNFKDNYISPTGTLYGAVVKNLQSTQALGYTYSGLPVAAKQTVDAHRASRLLALFGGGDSLNVEALTPLPTLNVEAASPTHALVKQTRLRQSMMQLVTAEKQPTRTPEVYALIKDITVAPGIDALRVFVNADKVDASTPDTDPHFVTQISFLQHGDNGEAHSEGDHKALPSTLVDLTPTLRELSRSGQLKDDTVSLQLIAVPREGAAPDAKSDVVPASVEIAVL